MWLVIRQLIFARANFEVLFTGQRWWPLERMVVARSGVWSCAHVVVQLLGAVCHWMCIEVLAKNMWHKFAWIYAGSKSLWHKFAWIYAGSKSLWHKFAWIYAGFKRLWHKFARIHAGLETGDAQRCICCTPRIRLRALQV